MIEGELKEALAELINISYGSATAAIADLFDNFAKLSVPGIDIVPVDQIEPIIMDGKLSESLYITTQQFKGDFEGEIIFILDGRSAQNMQALICDIEEIEKNDEDELETQQSILEISNILGSSCIGKLAELLESEVTFAPPAIEHNNQFLTGLDKSQYTHVIIISTMLEFEKAQIKGNLFIMFNNEMFIRLEKTLITFLEENI